MRKKIIGAICVVIGAIGAITVDILDTAGLMSKRWMYILKGGYQYCELFQKIEIAPTTTYKETKKPAIKKHRSPINKFIIDGEEKHLDQSEWEDNIDAFIWQFGQNKFNMVYVNTPNGKTQPIPIVELKNALSQGYTLMDDKDFE